MLKVHEYQMWYTMIEPINTNIVYTAADDAKFKGWDMRNRDGPIFQSTKHEYGVCCIKPWLDSDPNILMSGSYDTSIKLWDKRKLCMELCTILRPEDITLPSKSPENSIDTGKSVWDIKFKGCFHNEESKFEIMSISRY